MINHNRISERPLSNNSNPVLVDDMFSAIEARDLALTLLDATIQSQKLKNLRSQIHTEQTDDDALRSIEDLEQTRARIRELLSGATQNGSRVRLRSTFDLEIDDAPPSR